MASQKLRVATETWLIVLLVAIGCAVVVGGASISTGPTQEETSIPQNYDCQDPILTNAKVTTRLESSAVDDRPMFHAETEMQIGAQWPGVEGLTESPKSINFAKAVECLLPSDSTAYRSSAPEVSITDGRATIRDSVGYSMEDSTIPSDLGVWRFSYGDVKASACSDSEPKRKAAGSILAVVCPNEGTIRDATWDITVALDGFTLIGSSQTPTKYDSATSASWHLSGLNNAPLWLELRPSSSADAYFRIATWANGTVSTIFWPSGWAAFFGLMWLSARRLTNTQPSTENGIQGGKIQRLKSPHLAHLCLVGLLISATSTVIDVIYQLNNYPGPSAPSERIWAVFVLTSGAVLYSLVLRKRRGAILIISGLIVFLSIYFGPRGITLETVYGDSGNHNLSALQRFGYLNHIGLGILLVTTVTMFLLRMLSALIKPLNDGGVVSRVLERASARCAIGILVGIMVVGQWVYVRAQLDDRRALIPGRPRSLATVRDQLLDDLPWIPDFLGHWLPFSVYYAILLAGFTVLTQRASSAKDRELATTPDRRKRQVIMLIFAATVVGTAGQYRGISFPLAFLITLVLLWILGRRSLRLDPSALFAGVDLSDSRALERVQSKLLELSKRVATQQRRNEAMERKYEKGEVTPAAWVQETILRRLVERRTSSGHGVHGRSEVSATAVDRHLTDQEQALALGPYADWSRNALYATRIGLFLAIPVMAYDAFATIHSGMVEAWFSSQSGTLEAIRWGLAEILVWLVASFTLGALWPLIPGRRGFHKGAILGGIASIAIGADVVVLRALGEETWDAGSFVLLLCSYLAVVGVIVDVKTLKKIERQRWEFVDYLRLRDTRWLAAYGLTGLALASVVVTQVSEGKPLTSIPLTLIDAVTRGAG